jgi:hypothetical protein
LISGLHKRAARIRSLNDGISNYGGEVNAIFNHKFILAVDVEHVTHAVCYGKAHGLKYPKYHNHRRGTSKTAVAVEEHGPKSFFVNVYYLLQRAKTLVDPYERLNINGLHIWHRFYLYVHHLVTGRCVGHDSACHEIFIPWN